MVEQVNSDLLVPVFFHLHQPVGNFPGTFDYAFRRSYEPLVRELDRSGLDFNLHISGALLDWMVEERPDYIERLGELVWEERLELLGGGYYEPILAMLHHDDRRRQLERLADRLEELFDRRPAGAWLAERVWEPHLASELAGAGYRYTLLDDRHFLDLGWPTEQVYRTFATADVDESLAVFPIDERIRYLIPWEEPAATLSYLEGARTGDAGHPGVVVIMSDAEKMGLWPARGGSTYTLCYRRGWMRRFLGALADRAGLSCVRLSTALERRPPESLVYLPTASYDKMAVWALPTPARRRLEDLPDRLEAHVDDEETKADALDFIRGTHWRNFLVKYPSAGRLQRLYLYTRRRLDGRRCDIDALEWAELWDFIDRSVVNDHFWHGMFGGAYYHFLRHHSYRCLARVLRRVDDTASPSLKPLDYEGLGRPTMVFNDHHQLLVQDHEGAVAEWLSKEPPCGLAGGFTRIAEPYHPAKTPGFRVDDARRGFARIALLPPSSDGSRFLSGGLRAGYPILEAAGHRGLTARHRATVLVDDRPLALAQSVTLTNPGAWRWELELINAGDETSAFDLLLDTTPSPPGGPKQLTLETRSGETWSKHGITRRGLLSDITAWRIDDEGAGLKIVSRVESAARLWFARLITLEGTEAGMRRSWQGMQLVWVWRVELPPAGRRRLTAEFSVNEAS